MLKYISFIFTAKRNVNLCKEMLCSYNIPIAKTKKRNKKIAKEQLLLVHCNKVGSFFLVLCICILLLPKYIVCCNFCVGIYFQHLILINAVYMYNTDCKHKNKKQTKIIIISFMYL